MGSCVGKQTSIEKYRDDYSPTKPVASTIQPEEELIPKKQELEEERQPSAIIIDIEQEGNYLTLEENLRNSNLSEEQWINQHAYAPSVIIKRSEIKKKVKHKNQAEIKKDSSDRFSPFEDGSEGDEIDGVVQQEDAYCRLSLSSKSIDIEFMLPKSRAGPLVVPCIIYERYTL